MPRERTRRSFVLLLEKGGLDRLEKEKDAFTDHLDNTFLRCDEGIQQCGHKARQKPR